MKLGTAGTASGADGAAGVGGGHGQRLRAAAGAAAIDAVIDAANASAASASRGRASGVRAHDREHSGDLPREPGLGAQSRATNETPAQRPPRSRWPIEASCIGSGIASPPPPVGVSVSAGACAAV